MCCTQVTKDKEREGNLTGQMNTQRERRVGNSGEKVSKAERREMFARSMFLGEVTSFTATALS